MGEFKPRAPSKGPPRLHRRLTDGGLAPLYHTFAARLNELWRAGTRYYHKWHIDDYSSAETRINGDDLSVTLRPRDRFYFEFFTSCKPIQSGLSPRGSPTVLPACIGVDIALENRTIAVQPQIRTGARGNDGTKISLLQRPFQVQLVNEPSTTPYDASLVFGRNNFYRTLYESWAPMHSHTAVGIDAFTFGYQGYDPTKIVYDLIPHGREYPGAEPPTNSYNLRDVGFDVPYEDGLRYKPIRYALLNDGTVDWPRATGVITVKNEEFGDREFAIYIDTSNQFSVFPTSEIVAPNGTTQTLDEKYVKTAAPVFPGWVWVPSARFIDIGEVFDRTQPEYDWKVSPDGKKACAVVYARVAATFDTAYFNFTGTLLSGQTVMTPGLWPDVCNGVDGRQGTSNATTPNYFYAPGLVEATITIEITGDKPENFTLAVSIAELRNPSTSPYCTLLAGYVHHDIPDLAKRSDLIVTDIERYYRNSPQLPFFVSTYDIGSDFAADDTRRTLYSVKNLTQATEITTFPGWPSGVYLEDDYLVKYINDTFYILSGTPIPYGETIAGAFDTNISHFQSQIVDFDLATLSFVLKITTYGSAQWPLVKLEDGNIGNFGTAHISYAVYTFGKLREQFFPTIMNDQVVLLHKTLVAQMGAVGGFRNQYVFGHDWTLLGLNDASLNDWTASGFDQAITDTHRALLVSQTVLRPNFFRVRANWGSALGTTPTNNYLSASGIPLRQWWLSLFVYNSQWKNLFVVNPKPVWNMYQELINNALHRTPWSTFYVHAAGSWMLFDQSCIYNKEGTSGPFEGAKLYEYGLHLAAVPFSNVWDAVDLNNFEHFIVDRVHLEFQLAGDEVRTKDTSFVELYNQARLNLPDDKRPDFDELSYDVMRATFAKVDNSGSDGLGPFYSYSIAVTWYGAATNTWNIGYAGSSDHTDDNLNANGHKWRALNLGGGVAGTTPQAYTYHITFSSPVIIQY